MTTYTDVFGSDAVPSTLTGYVEVTLSANTQFYWPEVNSEASLVADIMDVTASGAFNLIMPPANQASVGRNILINNVGSETFSIVDNDSKTIVTLTPGQIKSLYLIDNSDAAGLWRVFTFGTGTSSADAALLNGNGLAVIDGKLAQMAENRTAATSATLVANDRASSYVFSSSGSVTCNLLAASTAGNGYFVMIANQSTGSVTLEPNSTETIDGATNKMLAPGESCIAVCDGVNWVTIGYGRSTEFQFTKLVLDVTTGSPFTLSTIQAQNKLLQLIGSPSANVILNVPKVVSVYYIQGAFSGANYVQVQTTTGDYVRVYGTDRVIVYCDGEDVVLAQTSAVPAADIAGGVAGAVVYQAGVGDTAFTSAGTAGQVLTSQGTSAPTWSNLDFSSLAGTVPVNKGGTGITSLPTGGLLRGNGVSPVSIASATDIVAAIGGTYVSNASWATTAGRAKPQRADGLAWDLVWSDSGGQETYVLGSTNGTRIRPCATSGLSVNYAASANYANSAGSCSGNAASATSVAWSGVTGKPSSTNITGNWIWSEKSNLTYLWGSNDGVNHYPVNRAGLSVNYAASANYANSAGSASSASYAASAGNADTVDGYHASNLPYAPTTAYVNISSYEAGGYSYYRFTRANGSYTNIRVGVTGDGGGGETCFPAGTLVLTARGWAPIEFVRAGDRVAAGDGTWTEVRALWRPLLGDRTLYEIDSTVRTTGDHMLMSVDGWAVIDPQLYASRRNGHLDIPGVGRIEHGFVKNPRKLDVGTVIRKYDAPAEVIESIEVVPAESSLQLYTLVTASGAFVVQGDYIVDGMPQEEE